MRLGIDFGTTRTVVAAAEDGRYPVASFDADDGFVSWLPGLAAWDGEGWRFGGEAGALLRGGAPGLRSIKRALSSSVAGDEELEVPGGRAPPVSALELAAGFLGWVRRAIVERSNLGVRPGEPLEAMIAVPANASSRQRYLTMEAFRRAGFDVVGMVNEPTAAAIEFAHRDRRVISPRSPKRYVVVYDLGGGTFDTAAVSLEGRRFELLTSEGIGWLGGDDVDALILTRAIAEWGASPAVVDHHAALLEVAREAKEACGPRSRRLVVDPAPHLDREPAVLDVGELCDAAEPLVARTLALLDRVFERLPAYGIDPESSRELGAVYLVGGAVAFPAFSRALRERHGRKVQLAPEPHAATAVGLAVAADPAAEVVVREASTRHVGVWRELDGGRDTVFDPLLSKDRLPDEGGSVVVRRRYRPAHTVGHLRFLECTALREDGAPDGDVTPFAEIRFPYDPRLADRAELDDAPVERTAALRGHEILETYTYDPDGSVTVVIENLTVPHRRALVLGSL